jgi:peroxiredoxin
MHSPTRYSIPLLIMLLVCAPGAQAADWNYRIGEDAPSFNLKTLDGKTLASEDLRGHYAVVSFMTTWCPFCNAAAPHLQKLFETYRDRGVRVMIVDIDEKAKLVKAFAAKHGLNCPILMDAGGKVTTLYAPPKEFIPDLERQETMIASFAIVDPAGKVRFLSLNEKPEEFDARLTKLRSRLDEMLAAK